MADVEFTTHYNLAKPVFDKVPWHDYLNNNFDTIDALLAAAGIASVSGFWTNSVTFSAGDRVIDAVDLAVWECLVTHATPGTGTFEDERTAHPTYWTIIDTTFVTRGAWATDTAYFAGDFVYDITEAVVAFAIADHTSTTSIRTDAANWVFIVDMKTNVDAAATSATSAAASASAASSSASDAAASAASIVGDAAAAATSATNAAASATAAASSASDAASSEASVAANASAAATSATNAAASESAAASSASTASSAATAAGTSETNAAASETAAGTSASNAAASESAAAASATAANASKIAAATSETNAATSETNAASSASSASTSATNAAASASAAETAQAAAEAAASVASVDRSLQVTINGGGSVITTGVLPLAVEVPYNCTIVGVRLLSTVSGSIVIDVWKDTYANYPPTDADSITASAPPTLTGAVKSEDTTLTGWTTALSEGDILMFNVDSVVDCVAVTLVLDLEKV